MSFTLYVAEDCHDCAEVVECYKSLGLDFPVLNVDLDKTVVPPVSLYAFPALFKGDDLVAYGINIMDYLKRQV